MRIIWKINSLTSYSNKDEHISTVKKRITNFVPEKKNLTCITRVHRNENSDWRIERNFFSHEVESFLLFFDCVLNAFYLDCNDGQHFDGDAIELVETAPSSTLRKTLNKEDKNRLLYMSLIFNSFQIVLEELLHIFHISYYDNSKTQMKLCMLKFPGFKL